MIFKKILFILLVLYSCYNVGESDPKLKPGPQASDLLHKKCAYISESDALFVRIAFMQLLVKC